MAEQPQGLTQKVRSVVAFVFLCASVLLFLPAVGLQNLAEALNPRDDA